MNAPSQKKNAPDRPRLPFERVHMNVQTLMGIFSGAAQEQRHHEPMMQLMYRLALVEYLNRVGWEYEQFTFACELRAAGQVPTPAPEMQHALS